MHLTAEQRAKADLTLQRILDDSLSDEILQVVMVLNDDNSNLSDAEPLKPSQFASRVEYRQALIEQRKEQLEMGTVGQTIAALNNLDLTIHGEKASRFLVVEGTAAEIIKSLSLSGVKSATFDQIIRIKPIPIDSKDVEYLSNLILEIVPGNKDKVFQAAKQYISNYYKSYGQLKVLRMRQHTKLEDIYTTVKVLPEDVVKQLSSHNGIQDIFKRKEGFSSEREDEKLTGIEVADQYQWLTVLGAPGSGKSTLLRKVGLDSIKGNLEHPCIPIFVELKQFNNLQDIDLLATIKEIFKNCNFPHVDKFINQGLQQGKFLLLLDGLDEVSNKNVEKVVKEARNLITNNDKNRFIISCRTAAYKQQFKQFNDVIIAEFDDTQIQDFINNWFNSETNQRAETAKKCLQALADNIGAKELAKTPLLLTFICLVYDKSQTLPKNRSELYKRALEILLEEWSAEKKLERDPIYKDFTTKLEVMLLSEIAYEGFIKDQLFFKTEELVNKIKLFLSRNLNAPKDLDGESVLNAIAIQQGILVERLDNIYSFSHLTLQEYLTAKYIVDNHLIKKTVNDYITDKRWKEIFILIAGLMEGNTGATQLLLYMENQAISYLKSLSNNHRFLQLLDWAETKTKTSPAKLTPVAKRVVAITNAYANAYAQTYAQAYANINDKAYLNDKEYANANANALVNALAKTNLLANAQVYASVNVNALANINAYANINARIARRPRDKSRRAYTNLYAIEYFIQYIDEMEKESPYFSGINLTQLRENLQVMKITIPNKNQSIEVHQKFAKQLLKTWLNTFGLTLNVLNLSGKKLKKLDQNYFYIYNLMLQCKDAAELITNETWEAIEERMYRVPS
ncbi:MAG: NACHT domain-containing protein [Crocosphaera sp.]|nr:NACHT domain-containing protein [Crocosphaera sp.]